MLWCRHEDLDLRERAADGVVVLLGDPWLEVKLLLPRRLACRWSGKRLQFSFFGVSILAVFEAQRGDDGDAATVRAVGACPSLVPELGR